MINAQPLTANAGTIPAPISKDDTAAWLYRSNIRHARIVLDRVICEDLCRCATCQMMDQGSKDPRACTEYYRIYEVISEIVEDRDITKESIE